METLASPCRLTPEARLLVAEFLPLNRRRLRHNPPLTRLERERWMDLRWLIEEASRPACGRQGPPRKALRVPADLVVSCTDGQREWTSHAREIGEGGLFLVTGQPAAAGAALRLTLTGASGERIELEASVVWASASARGANPPGMGVRFEGLDTARREAIAYLVEAAANRALVAD